jgi:hypothetical protein
MNEHFWGLKLLETQTNEHFGLKKGSKNGPIFSKTWPFFSSKRQKLDSAGFFLPVLGDAKREANVYRMVTKTNSSK